MKRLTCENPQTNTERLLNFAYAKNGRVYLRWADGQEDVDLCEYIANNACCTEIDAEAVMDGACLECDNRASALYRTAVQAAELRARLAAYEDTGLMPAEVLSMKMDMAIINAMLQNIDVERMKELAEADKDGRLIVLPCKAGDTVYAVSNNTDACGNCKCYSSWFDGDSFCDDPSVDEEERHYPNIAEHPVCKKQFLEVLEYQPDIETIIHRRNEFGKTIFLTREEAEKALRDIAHDKS